MRLALTSKGTESERITTEISTSSEIIHRGNIFDLYIPIQNPFKDPIKIKGWSWLLPHGIKVHGENTGDIQGFELQPGDSRSLGFPNKAIGLVDFIIGYNGMKRSWDSIAKTGEHYISINLSYEKNGIEHWQEVQSSLKIHAAPIEVYAGAIIGAVIGSFIKNPVIGFETFVSAAFGFFLVLIAKRRSDVQLGISVEDWMGGAILGFSIGYLGRSHFEELITTASK